MYKLILVDDEEEVRKGMLQKIDWCKYGFEIAGEAENGLEALEIAEKVVPDVVITDIKMPFMDGLTLSSKLREKFPTTKIIILTGFDEFEYAQKAIRLDVVEYVLKPISSKELIDVLINTKLKIDREIAQKKDIETLKEYYYKSLPLLREKFLCSLVTGKLSRDEIMEKSKAYGLSLSGRKFVVAVAGIDFSTAQNDGDSEGSLIGTGEMGISEDRELIKFAVLNICQEVLDKYGCGTVFINNDYIVIIFASEDMSSDAFMEKVPSILDEIHQNIMKYYKLPIRIGIGSYYSDIENTNYSYKNAVSAMDYSMIMGNNPIIYIEDVEPKRSKRLKFDELKKRSLITSIKVGTPEEISNTIEKLFIDVLEAKNSYKDYQIFLLEILTTILKVARDLNVDMDNLFGVNYNLFVEIYKFKDLRKVREWIKSICIKIRSYISQERQDSCKQIVSDAVEYLKENYSDSEITIDKVCKMLHISPAYFSSLFKKETKLTFVNYLTHIRMEAAKELLRSTNLKTFEIAKKVGYSEPNYFSYCFKKNFGISPSEYRNVN